MENSEHSALFKPWVGQRCDEILRHERSWQFAFAPAGSVTIESFWRIVKEERVAICSLDDGHKFGLPKPVDAAQVARDTLSGKRINGVVVNKNGDLTIEFEGGVALNILINSSGYESWNAAVWSNEKNRLIVATGGGDLAIFEQDRS